MITGVVAAANRLKLNVTFENLDSAVSVELRGPAVRGGATNGPS
jgi:hypothetical protein